jgi:ATP synthase protein I
MRLEPSAYRSLGAYGTLGIEFVVSVVFGLYAGRWLDQKFGTSGGFTVAGVVLGVVMGFRAIWRVAKRAEREASRDDPGSTDDGPPGAGPPHS